MANPMNNLSGKYKYGHLFHVERYPNGGGLVLHMWQDDLKEMDEKEVEEVAKEFLKVNLWFDVVTRRYVRLWKA